MQVEKSSTIAIVIFLSLIIFFVMQQYFTIISKKDIEMILEQCHIVRQDYKSALYRTSGASNADPQTTCFDSVKDAQKLRKFLKNLESGNVDIR